MTQILQVGDIVRVNRPTEEEWRIIHHPWIRNDYTSPQNLKSYIGQIGCIIEVADCDLEGISRVYVNPCNEDTEFLRDKDTLDEKGGFFTTTSHLEVVRESPFRSQAMMSGVPQQLTGTLLPTVTAVVPDGMELDYETTEGGRFHVGYIAFNGTNALDVEIFDEDDCIGGLLQIPYTAFEQSFTTF
jgi:hypothetical protein